MFLQKLHCLAARPSMDLPSLSHFGGLGAKRLSLLNKEGIFNLIDLLLHIPRRYEDRRFQKGLTTLYETEGHGRIFTSVSIHAVEFFYARGRRIPKIWIDDDGTRACLLCFGRYFLAKTLVPGSNWLLAGTFFFRQGELQCSQFEFYPPSEVRRFFSIYAYYSHLDFLPVNFLKQLYTLSLREVKNKLIDLVPDEELEQLALPDITWALEQLHYPDTMENIEYARRRLAYGELRQLYLNQQQKDQHRPILKESQNNTAQDTERSPEHLPEHSIAKDYTASSLSSLQEELIASLPFSLTTDQTQCILEMNRELIPGAMMYRLLQGDVGSGKTLVAILAALRIVEASAQVCFMVPTEVLAYQHMQKIRDMLAPLNLPQLEVYLFIASMKRAKREEALTAMQTWKSGIWLGTHSLFSEGVDFANLQLVIIDEQHRFGVRQREQLRSKARVDRVLMLSATPIPRTLTLTLFGNMDISTIRTMPSGRLAIKTHLAVIGREERVYAEVEKQLAMGHQAYFVYPRIEDTEVTSMTATHNADLPQHGKTKKDVYNLKSAEKMHVELRERFAEYSVGMVHGRQSLYKRQEEMNAFVAGKKDVLVATTVIEVGVDIANANVIVIEQAECFGLAALHQLRGRVGRGGIQSYCYLIYSPSLTDAAKERLRTLKESDDGFNLAEVDLKIRGPGSIAGIEQSGYLNLEFASLYKDLDMIEVLSASSRSGILHSI